MLGRTHELAAVSSLATAAILFPPTQLTSETAIVSIMMALVGGITPDLDKPGTKAWDKIPAGGCLSRIINPIFIGGHRHLTHSLLGMFLFGMLVHAILMALPLGPAIDANLAAWSFIIGFGAHLATDAMTKDGVPLLFPLPFHIGFPPVEAFRIRTNGLIENALVTPALIGMVIAAGYYNQESAAKLLVALGINS